MVLQQGLADPSHLCVSCHRGTQWVWGIVTMTLLQLHRQLGSYNCECHEISSAILNDVTPSTNVIWNYWKPEKLGREPLYFSVGTIPADGLAPFGVPVILQTQWWQNSRATYITDQHLKGYQISSITKQNKTNTTHFVHWYIVCEVYAASLPCIMVVITTACFHNWAWFK